MEADLVDEESPVHAPEPWSQDGRYVRDAAGVIVVRGRSGADARRIVAAVNGTQGIPTEALEGWKAADVSDPGTRPDLEIVFADEVETTPSLPPEDFPFDRRVMQRRLSRRRESDRRQTDRRRPTATVVPVDAE